MSARLEFRVHWRVGDQTGHDPKWSLADEDETAEEIHESLDGGDGYGVCIPTGLELAIDAAKFEWWVETRPAPSTDSTPRTDA